MPISERTKKLKDELIQALIEEAGQTGQFDIDAMPFVAMELFGHGFGRQVAAEIQQARAEHQAARLNEARGEEFACPKCGLACPAEAGLRRLKTLDGDVQFREPKCFCKTCRKTFFPSA